MLKGLSRYIFLQALGPLVLATVVLTGIVWLTQALRMLDVLIMQGQTLVTFFQLTALALPSTLVIVLPISLFCALLYTLHKLITDSEIVVMFSAGVSLWSVALPILTIAFAVSVLVLSFSVYVAPAGLRELKTRLYDVRTDVASSMIREGTFTNPTAGLTVYVRDRAADGTTHGILVHDGRNPAEPITYMAETGSLVKGPRGPLLVMFNGNIQRVSRGAGKEMGAATLLYFDKYTFDMSAYIQDHPAVVYVGRERYFSELINPAPDDQYGQLRRDKLRADAHERLVEGIYPVALALIALAALLPAPFNRRGYAMRMVVAAGAALGLRVVGFALANASQNNLDFVPLVYLVPIAACAISLAALGGVRFGRTLRWLPRRPGRERRA
ncbi:MAG: LPS export ABC transporter permease LptF [Parvibaculum sp.]|uniref:LPS export ABC transporter permease LptF n=1 Tax=Parvibaculum sp. TaxID=2024848 RepID=UPI002726BA6E|nr:LPS export ABC transporter permease LptF [Parvibaculum sp.]MDO8838238.1 LPS export ABC transporter permease LptF [Parvibaculum sp.]